MLFANHRHFAPFTGVSFSGSQRYQRSTARTSARETRHVTRTAERRPEPAPDAGAADGGPGRAERGREVLSVDTSDGTCSALD